MKVVVVGEFRPGFDVGLEYSYVRGFEEIGHIATPVPELSPDDLHLPRGLNHFEEIYRACKYQTKLQNQVIEERPDLVVVIKGRRVLPQTVRRWRLRGLHVVNVFPDNPFEAASRGLVARWLLRQLGEMNVVFVHDRFVAGQLRQLGIHAEFLPLARDPAHHVWEPSHHPSASTRPIVFVGNPDSERIRYLRAIADLGLGLYGNWQWANLRSGDPLASCVRGGVQLGSAMVATMRSARLSLNILRQSQKTAHNMRTFEIPACGVCCVSESAVGVQELMESDREVVVFNTPKELRRQVIRLLACPSKIDEVAHAGFERVAHETYAARASQILSTIG